MSSSSTPRSERIWPPTAESSLPEDGADALLVGRAWNPDHGTPSVVVVRDNQLVDITDIFPTMSHLTEAPNPSRAVRSASGTAIGSFSEVLANTAADTPDVELPCLLSPIDLHAVKAAGVTFAVSMIERLIEERAGGDAKLAAELRAEIGGILGGEIHDLVPGTDAAAELAAVLKERGLWSQYLEVGIGPDAEIFTKAQPLSSVGTAVDIGVLSTSSWNNPEPEVALMINAGGKIVGATLGNDVNLRDYEGRSALLLSKAKDNNASASIGPLIRLFDEKFGLDEVREAEVKLEIFGEDGFALHETSSLTEISRDPAELVSQLIGSHHQYPDGAVLMLGTLFAPTVDRDGPGRGFTHKRSDVVRISSARIGALVNIVEHSESCTPWTLGARELMTMLARRGVLK